MEEVKAKFAELCVLSEFARKQQLTLLQRAEPRLYAQIVVLLRAWQQSNGPRPFRAGEEVAGHRLLSRLGVGGTSEVWLASEVDLGRDVAFKVLRPDFVWIAKTSNRLQQEAKIQTALNHPNIPTLHRLDFLPDGRSWFTMPAARRTLGDAFRAAHEHMDLWRGNHASGQARMLLQALIQVCDAVGHAHERGYLHCDLKPSNILLGDHLHPWVGDWGAAIDERGYATGQHAGTPAYRAPEQERLERLSRQTDVYGLGALLYALLYGRPPEDVVIVKRSAQPPERGVVPVPEGLLAICRRAMALRPEDRFACAQALKEELTRWLEQDHRPQLGIPALIRPRQQDPMRWFRTAPNPPKRPGSTAEVLIAGRRSISYVDYLGVLAPHQAHPPLPLHTWLRGQSRAVHLLVMPQGHGKTRMMLELVAQRQKRWRGFARWIDGLHLAPVVATERTVASQWEQLLRENRSTSTFLVIDNADIGGRELHRLLAQLQRRGHDGVQILLLARQTGAWWDRLATWRESGLLDQEITLVHSGVPASHQREFMAAVGAALQINPKGSSHPLAHGVQSPLMLAAQVCAAALPATAPPLLEEAIAWREAHWLRQRLQEAAPRSRNAIVTHHEAQALLAAIALTGGLPAGASPQHLDSLLWVAGIAEPRAPEMRRWLQDVLDEWIPEGLPIAADLLAEALVQSALTAPPDGPHRRMLTRTLQKFSSHAKAVWLVVGRVVARHDEFAKAIATELPSMLQSHLDCFVDVFLRDPHEAMAEVVASALDTLEVPLQRTVAQAFVDAITVDRADLHSLPVEGAALFARIGQIMESMYAKASENTLNFGRLGITITLLAAAGQRPRARSLAERATATAEHLRHRGTPPNPAILALVLRTRVGMSALAGDVEAALLYAQQTRDVLKPHTDDHPELWAEALSTLATVYADLGNPRRAMELLNQTLNLPIILAQTRLRAMNSHSVVLAEMGRFDEALHAAHELVQRLRREVRWNPALRAFLGSALSNLALRQLEAHSEQGAHDAVQFAQEALDVHRGLHPPNPVRWRVATSWCNLATAYRAAGQPKAALDAAQSSLQLRLELYSEDACAWNLHLAWSYDEAARSAWEAGRADQARTLAEQAEAHFRAWEETEAPPRVVRHAGKLAAVLTFCAQLARDRGESDRADQLAQQAARRLIPYLEQWTESRPQVAVYLPHLLALVEHDPSRELLSAMAQLWTTWWLAGTPRVHPEIRNT